MVSPRTQTFLAVVFAVLLLPAGVAVAQTLSTHSATTGVQYVTNSGVEVTLGDGREVAAVPFDGDDTFADGDLRISGSDASIEVVDASYSGDPVDVRNVDASGGTITVERTDLSRSFTVTSGDASQLQVRDYAIGDGQTDLAYDSANGLTLEVSGFNDVGVVAVDVGTSEPLDSDIVGADGTAVFDLPAGTREIRLELAPSELRVYEERSPGDLLTNVDDLSIEFYEQSAANPDNIESVEVVNGVADMEGVDPTASFKCQDRKSVV